jgi:hypothetical protein
MNGIWRLRRAGLWRSWGLPVVQLWMMSEEVDNDDGRTDFGLAGGEYHRVGVGPEPYPGYPGGPETAPERMVTLHVHFHGLDATQAAEVVRRQAITDCEGR